MTVGPGLSFCFRDGIVETNMNQSPLINDSTPLVKGILYSTACLDLHFLLFDSCSPQLIICLIAIGGITLLLFYCNDFFVILFLHDFYDIKCAMEPSTISTIHQSRLASMCLLSFPKPWHITGILLLAVGWVFWWCHGDIILYCRYKGSVHNWHLFFPIK